MMLGTGQVPRVEAAGGESRDAAASAARAASPAGFQASMGAFMFDVRAAL